MSRIIFLVVTVLLFACQAESRQKGVKARKNLQFVFTTSNNKTKEVKELFRVHVDRARGVSIKVDADEEMIDGLRTCGKSLMEYAIDRVAKESVDGFYELPVEKQVKLMTGMQEELGSLGVDSFAREFADGFYRLPLEGQLALLIGLQKEFDLFGTGQDGDGLSKWMQGVFEGVKEEPDHKKTPKGKPPKGTSVKALKNMADSILGEGAVKEGDIKNLMDSIFESGVLEERKKDERSADKKLNEE